MSELKQMIFKYSYKVKVAWAFRHARTNNYVQESYEKQKFAKAADRCLFKLQVLQLINYFVMILVILLASTWCLALV